MNVRNLTRGGLLLALGIVLPQVFHLFGGSALGPVFLPMHIPVLMAGILVCPWAGGYVGLLSPLISHLLTGMPPMVPLPMLVLMAVELPVMGILAGVFYRKLKLNIFLALPAAMLGGRIALGLTGYALTGILAYGFNPVTVVVTAVVTGVWGIVIQLVLIPLLVTALERRQSPWAGTLS